MSVAVVVVIPFLFIIIIDYILIGILYHAKQEEKKKDPVGWHVVVLDASRDIGPSAIHSFGVRGVLS